MSVLFWTSVLPLGQWHCNHQSCKFIFRIFLSVDPKVHRERNADKVLFQMLVLHYETNYVAEKGVIVSLVKNSVSCTWFQPWCFTSLHAIHVLMFLSFFLQVFLSNMNEEMKLPIWICCLCYECNSSQPYAICNNYFLLLYISFNFFQTVDGCTRSYSWHYWW